MGFCAHSFSEGSTEAFDFFIGKGRWPAIEPDQPYNAGNLENPQAVDQRNPHK
jgi:hypothetical protein